MFVKAWFTALLALAVMQGVTALSVPRANDLTLRETIEQRGDCGPNPHAVC
ncbi:hypothetical protein D9619_006904 [Psilocybe cf. subviscida]|uniref:Uncharacterized protein n=1 Tax=Psilocybe cf. subviscida TaxID=2480587 RepID=A0A8H5EXI4_9AGAR|nr:hypothetical protein D9619_006904 [Psilocybe cf. subviscida]